MAEISDASKESVDEIQKHMVSVVAAINQATCAPECDPGLQSQVNGLLEQASDAIEKIPSSESGLQDLEMGFYDVKKALYDAQVDGEAYMVVTQGLDMVSEQIQSIAGDQAALSAVSNNLFTLLLDVQG